tara:strand:- start:384 stop:752 length:369 start_codon:yes stop_codon:yes gene_type:complete
MSQVKFSNKIKYLLISGVSFILSVIFLNVSFYILGDEQVSAQICLILLFIINLTFFLKFYQSKLETKSFIIIFLLSSIFFRLFEYFLFLFLLRELADLNTSWFLALIISFVCKFVIFDKIFN